MSAKNVKARHLSNCQTNAESLVVAVSGNSPRVPSQNRKEDAEKTLYLNRI